MEVLSATAAEAALVARETTALATRVATICDKINEHRDAGKPMGVRKAAAISAMIDDIAAEGMSPPRAIISKKKKARKGSARWAEEVSRLNESKLGVVVKSGDDVSGILREACFTAACRGHPSIVGYGGVTLTPAGSKDEYSLVVHQVGPSLADVMRGRGRPFPEGDVRRIMHQLLSAAKAMDERGILHRDINPANILFDIATGTAKIFNFSTAMSTSEKTQDPALTVLFAGTNGYTAPEVLLRNPDHDAAADAWSLGCVMMELIVGRVLFKGGSEADQLYRIFDVIGVPGKKAMMLALKPRVIDEKEVERRRARQRRVGHRNQLRELFPELVLSQEGFDVLSGLLTCDPTRRLTPAAALRCPWFDDDEVDDDQTLVNLSSVVSWTAGAVTKSCELVLKMAVSAARRALGLLLSPKRSP